MNSLASQRSQPRSDVTHDGAMLSRGLGWFSLALGAAELTAPHALARAMGIRDDRKVSWILRAFGARELVAGLGILLQPRRPLPIWSRVAGDMLDLAALGVGALTRTRRRARMIGAFATVAGALALDALAGRRVQRSFVEARRPVIFGVTINRPPHEVYAFYRQLARLPQFMEWLESVTETGAMTSHWVARLPVGTIEWDAEIVEDRPGQVIAWKTIDDSKIEMQGRVTFARAPGRAATEVRCEMQLGFLGTRPTTQLAKFFAKPQIKGDLRRLKQVLETGEVLS